jgi:hypothetical protein
MLSGPYATNTYGQGISCQGPTFSLSPFVTKNHSYSTPYQSHTITPYYDPTDKDEDNVPDNPGKILYYQKMPSGQKDNHAVSLGVSATISVPLDRELQRQCKESVASRLELQKQALAKERLNFELARLKNCGELAQKGISFHPKSKFYVICSDVILVPKPGQVLPHKHKITVSKPDAKRVKRDSGPAEPAAAPKQIPVQPFSPESSQQSSPAS